MKLRDIWEFPRSKEYVFHTDLSVDECVKRLRNAIGKNDFWPYLWVDAIVGEVRGQEFHFRSRGYANKNRLYFFGRLTTNDSGTIVSGYFGIGGVSKLLISLLLVILLMIMLLKVGLGIIIFSFFGGFVIFLLSATGFERIEKYYLDFLTTTLEATQAQPKPSDSKSL
jgi:hypothetical protein